MCTFNSFSIVFTMKKDLLITITLFSFFSQHPGKPHQLFYFMGLYDCDDLGKSPGYFCAEIATKYRQQ